MASVVRIAANTGTAPTSLPQYVRDKLLDGANGGVPWLVDVGYDLANGATLSNGLTLTNIAGGTASTLVVAGSTMPTVAGRGIDFTGVDAGTYVTMPAAAVAQPIVDAGQEFLLTLYMGMPADADWTDATGQSGTFANFCEDETWLTQPDIVGFRNVLSGGTKQHIATRQTGAATGNGNRSITPITNVPGAIAQIAFWRDGTNENYSFKSSATGRITDTAATGSDNTESIAALVGKIGVLPIWAAGGLSTAEGLARKMRFYGGFLEIPSISGRTPLTVLEADYTRRIGKYS